MRNTKKTGSFHIFQLKTFSPINYFFSLITFKFLTHYHSSHLNIHQKNIPISNHDDVKNRVTNELKKILVELTLKIAENQKLYQKLKNSFELNLYV
jgi:activator of HSP90 ATPase